MSEESLSMSKLDFFSNANQKISEWLTFKKFLFIGLIAAGIPVVLLPFSSSPTLISIYDKMVSFWGLFVLMAMAYLLSNNRAAINVRLVISGIALQLVFALFILKTSVGAWFFNQIANTITSLLAFTDQGTAFLFGNMLTDPKTFGFIFALKVLPLIIFVSSLTAVLYYFGILQRVVGAMAWVMSRVMKTSGTESLAAAANTFVGQTEAPLFIRPYISNMTNSELMALMVGGFATIAGAVMVTYAAFIAEAGLHAGAGHLLAASVISAPAALVIAKIMFPETQASQTSGYVKIQVPITDVNALDAAARGASEGLKLAVNVAAMLLAFIAFIHLFNWMVGKGIDHALFYFGQAPIHLTLDKIFGWAFSPIAWIMGVPWRDCLQVGNLLGQKTIINEFVGYLNLVPLIKEGVISERSQIIAIYALCGFSNLSSIAIQLGGIGPLAPERRGDLAKLGLRAMIAGSIACFMTATIAGMIIK